MAGFVDNDPNGYSPPLQRIRDSIKKLSTFGMKYNDMVIRNSQSVGVTEGAFLNKNKSNVEDESMLWSLAKQDVTTKQFIAYFDKDYKGRREYLRKFSLNPEIEWVLDVICDEAITYDNSNYFAYSDFLDVTEINEKLKNDLDDIYKDIYEIWGFSDDITAWQYFRQLMIDGFLAFEIIYDDTGNKIIGFKELDPITLVSSVEKQMDGTFLNTWIQNPQDAKLKRVLYDTQIIYISFAKGNSTARLSYIERLIKPYNTLRIIEQSRVTWAIMNASFKMKMTVPIGTKSQQKGMQTLGELMSIYKEDIQLNSESGELMVDGSPKIQFYKNYLIPSGVNGTPTIEPIDSNGPDLNNMEPLSYFFDRFVQESKVPGSRFTNPDGSANSSYVNGAEGLDKEEIKFFNFISRLRSIFQEMLTKPLWIQMVKLHPKLADDYLFKSQIGLDYFSDNPFRTNQEIEMMSKNKESVDSLIALTDDEGEPFFSTAFLIEEYMGLSEQDIKANKEARKLNKKTKPEGDSTDGEEDSSGESEEVTL